MTKITLEDHSPHLRNLRTKRHEITLKKNPLTVECTEVRTRLRDSPSQGTTQANRVAILLGETPAPERAPDDVRLGALLTELQDLNTAIEVIDAAVSREIELASRKLCESVAPDHKALVKDIAKKLTDLHRAYVQYEAFVDAVSDTGASTGSLNRIWPIADSNPRDKSGPFYYAFKSLLELGYIQQNEIPKELNP